MLNVQDMILSSTIDNYLHADIQSRLFAVDNVPVRHLSKSACLGTSQKNDELTRYSSSPFSSSISSLLSSKSKICELEMIRFCETDLGMMIVPWEYQLTDLPALR